MLKPKQLATSINRLQVPVIVSDILNGDAALSGDVQYGLHEVISDLQPDSALLCVALSAKKIASKFHDASPSMKILEMESSRIIEDYAELWLLNAEDREINEADALEAISRTSEDLESLAELLDLTMHSLKTVNAEAWALCDILSVQSRAHALIAETYIEALESVLCVAPKMETVIADKALSDNVIQFPVRR